MHNNLLLSNYLRFFIFSTIFFVTLLMKIFQVPTHGGDSVSNSVRIETIITNGMLTWILSPLSYFGWYPFSYPSGVHSLLASLSLTTGLSINNTVLIFSYFQGFIAFLNIFILSRSFFYSEINSILSSLFFIFSIYILSSTWNIIVARSVFVIFYPVIINTLIQISQVGVKNRGMHIFMFTLFFITLVSLHRIILFFSAIVIFSYIIVITVDYFFSVKKLFLRRNFRIFLMFILLLFTLFQMSDYRFYNRLDETYMTLMFEGDSPVILILNVYATYGTYYGACVTFLPFGALYFINSESRSFPKDLMTTVCLISIFFILDASYFLVFSTPFIGILTLKSFSFFKSITNNYAKGIISLLIYLSLVRWFIFAYTYNSYIILTLCFLLSFNIIRGIIQPKKYTTLAVVSMVIFSVLCAFIAFPLKNLQIYDSSDNYSGKFNIAHADYDRAHWVDKSLNGDFLASSSDVRNTLWLYSDSSSGPNHHDISNFLILTENLEINFNISLLYTSGQKAFDENLDSRYNPKRIEEKIFLNNEQDLVSLYEISFIVIDAFEASSCDTKVCKLDSEFTNTIKEDKYNIYEDNRVKIYHYE